jgi:Leucine-rich repeat (LRR) protein
MKSEAEALSHLWSRALNNVKRSHLLNAKGDKCECLTCGHKGQIQERALTEHIFCAEECQRGFWGIDTYFSLGMKRGVKAIEERQPDFRTVHLPDDVLGVIFAWAYRFALYSLDEYAELMSMRTISKQFERVIDERVIPSLHFLGGEILREIPEEELALFTDLQVFLYAQGGRAVGNAPVVQNPFPQLTHRPWAQMTRLRVFSLTSVSLLRYPEELSSKKFLTKLQLRNVGVKDEAFRSLVHVEELSLARCQGLTHDCLLPLKKLVKLELEDLTGFDNLNSCLGLKHLKIMNNVTIDETGIAQLSNVESLALPYLTQSRQQRALPENQRRRIAENVLSKLSGLVSLDLTNNTDIHVATVNQLTQLVTLNIAFTEMDTALLNGLTNLTSLNNSGNSRHLLVVAELTELKELFMDDRQDILILPYAGRNGIVRPAELPPGITTLSLDISSILSGSIALLTELTCLYLCQCMRSVDDDELKQLTKLQVLDLSGPNLITDAGLETLVHVEELTLTHNQHITFEAVVKMPSLRYLVAVACELNHEHVRELRNRGVIVFDDYSVEGIDPLPPRYRRRYQW